MPWALNEAPSSVVSIFTSFIPGFRLVDGEDLATMSDLLFSARQGVKGGTTQINAQPLETFISQVTSGGTVVLPPGLPGRYLLVMNDTAATIQIYGSPYNPLTGTPDTVAGSGGSTQGSVTSQSAGTAAEYFCFAAGQWKQFQGGTSTGGGSGIPDAPINGITYGRLNGAWTPVLPLSGGTMSGPIILPPGTPTNPNSAISLAVLQALVIDEGTY
jgi:hypothetical protein